MSGYAQALIHGGVVHAVRPGQRTGPRGVATGGIAACGAVGGARRYFTLVLRDDDTPRPWGATPLLFTGKCPRCERAVYRANLKEATDV